MEFVLTDLRRLGLVYQAKAGFRFKFGSVKRAFIVGAVDTSRRRALLRMRSEYEERLRALHIETSLRHAAPESLHPQSFICPVPMASDGKKMWWVEGRTIRGEKPILLPATAVYLHL